MSPGRSPTVTRRGLFRLLAAGAGFGITAAVSRRTVLAQRPGWLTAASPAPVVFPAGAIVRTILADLPPAALAGGATLFHEHLFGDYASPPATCPLPCLPAVAGPIVSGVDLLANELQASAADGIACIVNSTYARATAAQMQELRELATRSGMPIVAAGGYFRAAYPPDFARQPAEQFADALVRDAAAFRWGAFGEVGTSMPMEADERKFLIAVSLAQARTGLPIFTHVPHQSCPSCALEQLDVLMSHGVSPSLLCIGHLSTIKIEDDPAGDALKAVARAGAFVGFDTVGHQMTQSHIPERQKVARVLQLLEAGFEDHLLLSSDFAQPWNLKANWGHGFSSVVLQFVPKLRHAGVGDAILHKILVDNPRRFLAFVPKPR